MIYLLDQFRIAAAVALVLGVAIGWFSRSARPGGFTSGWVPIAQAALAAGAAAAFLRLLPGRAGLVLDLAVLFGAAYVLGCLIGAALRLALTTDGDAAPASSPATASLPSQPIPGEKPPLLASPPKEGPDDLKLIKGIGPQNEARLNALGVWRYAQIAAWTPEQALWVGTSLAFPGRIEREDWIGQAKILASGGTTSFAQRATASNLYGDGPG